MRKQFRLLLELFLTFFKIGPLTFGGGYAMIPMIEREVVTNKKWLKTGDVADIFAIAESVPGAIGINSATFIGYRIARIPGALTAMFGILLPTFIIVVLLSISYMFFQDNPHVEAAFQGIRPAIVALIAFAGYKIGQMAIFDKTTLITAVVTTIILLFSPFHPALIIVLGGIFGVLAVRIKERLGYRMDRM